MDVFFKYERAYMTTLYLIDRPASLLSESQSADKYEVDRDVCAHLYKQPFAFIYYSATVSDQDFM